MQVFGFAGWSGAGKTTLVEQVIPRLTGRGLRVSLIKHAHHDFDIDQPGKDSHRHRVAGCGEVLVAGGQRWALIHELRGAPEPSLGQLLNRLGPCDLVLVEGFKHDPIPKVEVHRPSLGKPLRYPEDPHIVAVASDQPLPLPSFLTPLDLNDPEAVAVFILGYLDGEAPKPIG